MKETTPINIKERLKQRGVCVVIPTYNNATTLADVIQQTLIYCHDIIVINDGSTDCTYSILTNFENKITTVSYHNNRGKGYALKQGFQKAITMGFAYAITIDSDGQHYPKDIVALLEKSIEHPEAIVVGKRDLRGVDRSKGSKFANKFANLWFVLQTWVKGIDTQSGFRLYPLKKTKGTKLLTARYEAELSILVLSSWHGVEIVSAPIEVFYPTPDKRVSHFRPLQDFIRITVLNTILCVLTIIYALPLKLLRLLFRIAMTLYTLIIFCFTMFVVVNPFLLLYTKIGKDSPKKRDTIRLIIHRFARFATILHGIPLTRFSRNTECLDTTNTPKVIIANHQSYFDLIYLLALSKDIVFLTNRWVWHSPFLYPLIKKAEYYPITDGIENIITHLQSLVERGKSIVIFPEGTRSKNGKTGRFHKGAFFIAERLNISILPVIIYGTGRVLPKHQYVLNKGLIHIEQTREFTQSEIKSLGDIKRQSSFFRSFVKDKYENLCDKMDKLS